MSGLYGGSIRGAGGTHPLLDGGDGSVRGYSFFSDRMVYAPLGGSRCGLKVRGLSGAVSAMLGLSGGSIRGAGGTHPLLDGGDGSVRGYSFFSDRMV